MAARPFIDLFSDTMTKPTPAMRKAMAEAEVGDEQKGEDPTTRRLEERVAALLGKDDAVFLPSGTMCNQIALAVHCRAGDEILAPDNAHIFTYEGGGASVFAGAQARSMPAEQGIFTAAAVEAAIRNPARAASSEVAAGRARADDEPRRRRGVAAGAHRGGGGGGAQAWADRAYGWCADLECGGGVRRVSQADVRGVR